ncbi:hypothetical protein ABEB36_013719 [Hypothenemus hampei]|uniref:Homeodomain-like DNA binding domain-containing transcription factor n=1 Tax=Hypothenemus hampei TaxID=57062 RepID=A0ABD1E5F2_HYPHA
MEGRGTHSSKQKLFGIAAALHFQILPLPIMPNLSEVEKADIVSKFEEGWSIHAVAQLYIRNKKTILNIKKRWEQQQPFKRKVGSGRPRISNRQQDAAFLDRLKSNPFETARDAVVNSRFPGSQPTANSSNKLQ